MPSYEKWVREDKDKYKDYLQTNLSTCPFCGSEGIDLPDKAWMPFHHQGKYLLVKRLTCDDCNKYWTLTFKACGLVEVQKTDKPAPYVGGRFLPPDEELRDE